MVSKGTVDGWQYDGKRLWTSGLVKRVYGVFYNKDILADAGLDEAFCRLDMG